MGITVEQYRQLLVKANRGKSAASEHDLQVQCVQWFRAEYPEALIYAIPNGGWRTITTASHLKMEGQLAGVPDLHIPIARHGFNSLYIEMKNGKAGKISDKQNEMINKLRELGNMVTIVRSFEEFQKIVKDYIGL